MGELQSALYEALVTDELASQLEALERMTPELRRRVDDVARRK